MGSLILGVVPGNGGGVSDRLFIPHEDHAQAKTSLAMYQPLRQRQKYVKPDGTRGERSGRAVRPL